MTDDVLPPSPNGARRDRREFQFLVGAALAICLGMQGVLMWRLMSAQPPDSSWDLIKNLMAHLGQVDVLLIGGLLGMAQQQKT